MARRFLFSTILVMMMSLLGSCGAAPKKDMVIFNTDMGYVQFAVDVRQSSEGHAKGLSGVAHLPQNKGMLFLFENSEVRHFWMKDMLIPLDILFIGADKKVVHILRDMEPCPEDLARCPSYSSLEPALYVVEINAGLSEQYGISVGSTMEIEHH